MSKFELIYLWVEEYKNIKNQRFNFSPRFECRYDKDTEELAITGKEYINIFPDNLNITAIVGENGSGKSSLLDFILEQNEYNGIFVFKYNNKLLVFHKNLKKENIKNETRFEITLNPESLNKYGTSLLFMKSFIDINTYKMSDFLIPRRFFHLTEKIDFISDLHKNSVELFNIVSINSKKEKNDDTLASSYSNLVLNNHFSYLKSKYLHIILKHYPNLKRFIAEHFKIENIKFQLKDLGKIFLASPSFKDNYKRDEFLKNMYTNFDEEKLTINRFKILCLIFCYLKDDEIKKFILSQKNINFVNIYNSLMTQNYDYFFIWDSFINLVESDLEFEKFIEKYLEFIEEIRHDILEFSFTPMLSSGEEKLLYLITNMYNHILNMKKSGVSKFTIIVDEPDTLLHPNWQKKFISLITNFINVFFKNDTFNFIMTSHSPFILSDLPKGNIVFLDKYKENDYEVKNNIQKIGNCKNVTSEINIKTFGSNIHTLLSHGFFMNNGLMGEFAKNTIDKIIKFLNGNNSFIDIPINKIKHTINSVGEDFLKTKLLDMYYKKFNDDFIREQRKQELLKQKNLIEKELKEL
ncbi:hypothetical protein CP965_00945 [Halarcobacter mediterraneus]|uniref:ATPase AAA-type core domain-containing protein n=1 Tax=Halarcobacter mediterraneus TaxID=2023153 RepID=A0A4Q1AWF2_9BACT|nr:AAA family ATPase [Halarcobacter mediterraneus]RXK14048.1 hypothetical protein CP965_00945 [Halarcobacter mediterraneus]